MSAVGTAPKDLRLHYKCEDFIFYENADLDKYLKMLKDIEKEYFTTNRDVKLSSLTYETFAEFFAENVEKPSSAIEKAQLYIKNNFTAKITLEQISRHAGISVSKLCHDFNISYFCRAYRKRFGKTPMEDKQYH